ncbi:DUF2079 domain-containing protein [Streptomyces sp. CA-294286]|uniref:DUF2079 domain-containing protein n=1 Tax=Streptomyces sp. CA-294286 TaxID=3240070 RepID=UPI003D8C1D59
MSALLTPPARAAPAPRPWPTTCPAPSQHLAPSPPLPPPAPAAVPAHSPGAPRVPAALLSLLALVVHAAHSLRLHATFRTTGYDLGIFGQAVRAYAEGELPSSAIRATTGPDPDVPFPILGDHFHPVIAVLAPLYRLAPHVETLLLAQAALVAWSVYVVARAGGSRIGVAYALCWGVQRLIGFDFHEVAFALPLLALSLAAYRAGRWRACAVWAAGLLLVKEDLGATVLVLGLLLVRHHRRAGLTLCVLGPAATAFAVLLVLPHFNPSGAYTYVATATGGTGAAALPAGLEVKATTLLCLLLPTLFLALRSPLVLLALPTLAWRFLSANPSYWGTDYHYSAVLMPIAFFALIDALDRGKGAHVPVRTAVVAVAALLATALPLAEALRPAFWRDPPSASAARQALAHVPDGTKVAATNRLAPHLTDRATVFLHSPGRPDARVDWMVLDTTDTTFSPHPAKAVQRGFHQVYAAGSHVVLRRDGAQGRAR